MYPDLHKICLDRDPWCRTPIYIGGQEFYADDPSPAMIQGLNVKWRVPCKRGQRGARADLDRASTF